MYDNLPFTTTHKETINAIINHDEVKYISRTEIHFDESHHRAGEIKCFSTFFKYYNLKIRVKYNSNSELILLTCRGSFHYLKNLGKHNADNIKLTEAINFLKDFANKFKIDLKHLRLLPWEFAQMIDIPFDVETIVANTFCEERKMFNNNSAGNPSKKSGTHRNDYQLKTYGKYAEFPDYCLSNTYRAEYKAKKTRVFQTKTFKELYGAKIETMADLLEIKNWLMLRDMHIEKFNQLVIYDEAITLPKNSKQKKEIVNFSNHNYWQKLIEKCKKGELDESEYTNKVYTLRTLSKKYGKNVHGVIMQLIEKQWSDFLNLTPFISFKISRFSTHAPLLKNMHAPFIECMPCNHFRKTTLRFCLATAYDISMQRPDSDLLSNTGLKYLEKHNPNAFNDLKRKLLTGRKNKYEKDVYSMMSKQIRNRFYNSPPNNPNQNRLF